MGKSTLQKFIEKSQENEQGLSQVFRSWGLKPITAKRFGIGYADPSDQELIALYEEVKKEDPGTIGMKEITEPALVVPIGKDFFIFRNIEREGALSISLPMVRTRRYIFNERALYNNETERADGQPVFICHSIEDALAYLESDFQAVYVVNSKIGELAEDLEIEPTWNKLIATFSEFPKDPESIGIYKDNMERSLTDLKKQKVILSEVIEEASGRYRSLFDFYRENPEGFRDTAKADEWKAVKGDLDLKAQYNEKASGPRIPQFRRYILNRPNRQAIPTGFNGLDGILDGGLYQGLYTVGAVSSLGKTAFCLQVADQMAEKGQDVLFFTLEQTAYELMARSVSRLTYQFRQQEKEGRTYRDILNKSDQWDEEQKNAVFKAMDLYQKQTDNHIFFIEKASETRDPDEDPGDQEKEEIKKAITFDRVGVKDIEEAIIRHLTFRPKTRPVVIIDYLQILEPMDDRKTDKQNMDAIVSVLRKLSADYDLPIIVISSFNRQSYNGPVELDSFKESGIIEYSSDVVIGIEPRNVKTVGKDKDAKDNRDTFRETKESVVKELKVRLLKNRHGKLGDQAFTFNGMYSFYSEGWNDPGEDDGLEDWTPTITH